MSRFFKGAVSSSDSDSSSASDDEVQQTQSRRMPTVRDFAYPSDREDDEKRVVKTHKDRRFEELKELIKKTKNARVIKDLSLILQCFEDLQKLYTNSKTIFARQNISTPRFYVRYLVDLEDYVNELWEDKDAKKTMSKMNAKSLSGLRQKVRKYNKEVMEADITAYKANPDPAGYESPEDEVKQGSDDEAPSAAPVEKEKEKKLTKKKPARQLDSDDSGSDDDWSSDDDSSSSSDSDIDIENQKMEDLRKYFLKKEFRGDADDRDEKKKKRQQRQGKQKKVVEEEDDDDTEWTPVASKSEKPVALFEPKQEITHEVMLKKLDEVMQSRGKKSTNRKDHVRTLQELYKISDEKNLGLGMLAKILVNIIGSLFELNSKISDFMDFNTWAKTLSTINSLLDLLMDTSAEVDLSLKFTDDDENVENAEEPYRVNGSILLYVHRLDTELTKILQNADCHSNDYIDKLKGEKDMCTLIVKTQDYVDDRVRKDVFTNDEICKIYMLRIEHLYYKYEDTVEGEESAGKIVEKLCKKIYALDDEKRLRQRAMLCHVYHLALHDKWHEARDLMLMSHLQAIVDHSDVSTQILYNRTICQLGLCAFRHGFIKEAHQGLSEIQNTQRSKELLAQGMVMRQNERTQEQEKVERSRQVPYHMHINIELMECVYLICSMLLEIPHMASHEFEMRRRLLSRSFHYQLKQSEKSSLIGPPENTREHVVAASRAMLAGDWRKCRDYIVNEKMNVKVWNLFRQADGVRSMVVRRIQEESLRTYLMMYSTVYATVSLARLSRLFEMERKDVHAIISKMILSEELSATLDEPTDCVMMHRVEPSRLQLLALNLADKLQGLQENNEQLMEPRGGRGGYSGPGAWNYGRTDRGDKGQGRQGGNYNRQDGGARYGGEKRQGGGGQGGGGGGGGAWGTGGGRGDQNRRRDGVTQKNRY
ncbi:eif-3.C [Pristionchus pacificus]|uniref:Eukaryotic translation initiation factor 3 subunit C n=1 Tax=Pristionchus pacificus TaxID=54126 RepID=A0A2A6C518_PRIPA|nr:eif-3.C [Pristionchus pacificus]|eukprot:PDM73206.1 eif-3.C [Pristionchus pacificus]